jgi:all-trans-retinol 13,14-reductase
MHALSGAPAATSRARIGDGESFDAIVIGSGIGGLACASLLARLRGLRVVVLERHYRLGGYTQRFARPGGRRWDTGLHYLGQLQEGTPARALMDVVTGGAVRWCAMPSPFERYHFPGRVADQPAGRDAYQEALVGEWPREARAIGRYFREIELATRWFVARPSAVGRRASPGGTREPGRQGPGRGLALRTTNEALDACGLRSPDLRAILTAQWGDYGIPPAQSAFAAHALVVSHFMDGGWFPEGGGAAISEGARAAIEACGGACLVRHEVLQVVVEGGRAVGVRVACGPERRREERILRAPNIISDAGATNTFQRLVQDSGRCAPQRAHIAGLPAVGGAVQLFVSLRESPECLGVAGENHWLFAGFDHDALYARRGGLVRGEAVAAFVSFPSLNDPSATGHGADVVAPVDPAAFTPWAPRAWRRRGADYEALKEAITATLLAFADHHLPGFASLVGSTELATPLSFEHFAGHPAGAIYGLPAVPRRFDNDLIGVQTPVPGLLLTGSDVFASGIIGAAVGGAMTAGHMLGAGGFPRVMAAVQDLARAPLPLAAVRSGHP